MAETRTERASCKFTVQQVEDGKQTIVMQPFHDTIAPLRHAVLGFSLLAGITSQQAKRITETLNEFVLEAFVTISDLHPLYKK